MGVFLMPSLGADMEAARLVEWLVQPGDHVSRGDVVAVVETHKGAIEVEIFEEGTVHELTAEPGEELAVGAPIALVLAEGEAAPEATAPDVPRPEERAAPPAPPSAPSGPAEPLPGAPEPASVAPPSPAGKLSTRGEAAASPAARLRARALGIDLSDVAGTGPGGVIVLADVEARPPGRAAAPPTRPRSPKEEMRHAIAAAMTRSKQTIPHFYLSETINVQPALDFLERRNADRSPVERVLLIALFAKAVARAAQSVGILNGHFIDGAFQPSERVNTGIAIALRGGGLVAPALHDAADLDLDRIMARIRDLVSRARAGRLRSSEMTEGTITVSSLGEKGAEAMAGVIFPPQVALIGIGAPHLRPWVDAGSVVPRNVVTLTVSADHRVSDGRQVAKFIALFETLMRTPEDL